MLRAARKEAALTKMNKNAISISAIPSFEISNDLQSHDLSIQSAIFKTKVYNNNTVDYLLSKFECETDWFKVGGRNVAIFGGIPHPSGAIVESLPSWLLPISQQLKTYFNDSPPDQVLLNRYDDGQGIQFHNDGPLFISTAAILSFNGDALLEFRPTSVNSGSSITTQLSIPPTSFSAYLPPNSLFVFKDSLYTDFDHGIIGTTPSSLESSSNKSMPAVCINSIPIAPVVLEDDIKSRPPLLLSSTHPIKIETKSQISNNNRIRRYSLTFRRLSHVAKTLDEFGPCSEDERIEIHRRKNWWLQAITDDHNNTPIN